MKSINRAAAAVAADFEPAPPAEPAPPSRLISFEDESDRDYRRLLELHRPTE